MSRFPRSRGASAVEYAGAIVLAAVVLGGLYTAGVGAHLTDGVTSALCRILGPDRGDCEKTGGTRTRAGGKPRRAGTDTTARWIVPPDKLPKAKQKHGDGQRHGTFGEWEPPKHEKWFGFHDRGDYTWDCGKVFDVACKIGGGFAKGGRDLWDGATTAGCLLHLCSHSGFKKNWSDVGHLFTQNPLTTGKQMWDGFKKPFVDSWHEGGPGKALAYVLPSAFAGVLKPFKLARAARDARKVPKVPHVPGRTVRVRKNLKDSRKAAESGDVAAADRSIAALRKEIADARRKDRAAGCPVGAPAPGRRPGHVAHAALTVAALPADDGDCGAADRLARELGVTGDKQLDSIVALETARRAFFATRKGARVSKQLDELRKLEDESGRLADDGDVRTARRRAKAAELIANDLKGRAKREKDPERRRVLSDAAASAEALELRIKDNARTAGVVRDINEIPFNPADRHIYKTRPIREIFKGSRMTIDYDGHGASYVDHTNLTPDGRPVLRLDRSRFNSDAEVTAETVYATMMDENGYFRVRDDGLRKVSGYYGDPGHRKPGDRYDYATRVNQAQEKAYLPAVRELYRRKVDPADVGDPVLREVYRQAHAKLAGASPGLKKKKLKGKDLVAGQDEALREGIGDALQTPMDDLGGRSPYDVSLDEYDTTTKKGD